MTQNVIGIAVLFGLLACDAIDQNRGLDSPKEQTNDPNEKEDTSPEDPTNPSLPTHKVALWGDTSESIEIILQASSAACGGRSSFTLDKNRLTPTRLEALKKIAYRKSGEETCKPTVNGYSEIKVTDRDGDQRVFRTNIECGVNLDGLIDEKDVWKLSASLYPTQIGDSTYYQDPFGIYFGYNSQLEGADSETFTPVGSHSHATDKDSVYYRNLKIEAGDPGTFEVVERYYSKDSTRIYYKEKPLADVDVSSWVPLEDGFSKDSTRVYYEAELLSGVVAGDLEILGSYFFKSGDKVGYKNKIYEDADASSFEFLGCGEDKKPQGLALQSSINLLCSIVPALTCYAKDNLRGYSE